MKAESTRKEEFIRETIPHMDLLYGYALRMTHNAQDAEDLIQETYLKAYRFWEHYEVGTNVRAWMFRILKNSMINEYRKDSRQPDTVNYDLPGDAYSREESAESKDQRDPFHFLMGDEVERAVAALPHEFRTVAILCDIEGLSYREIAEFTRCPIGTVRSRLHRARKLLSGKLKAYAHDRIPNELLYAS
jgi:RNA polymerase sigma-70 factor, ECF subfamily